MITQLSFNKVLILCHCGCVMAEPYHNELLTFSLWICSDSVLMSTNHSADIDNKMKICLF